MSQDKDNGDTSPEAKYELRTLEQTREQIDEVKEIMVNNIDKVLERGDRIELLVTQTGHLQTASQRFQKQSTRLRRAMQCRRIRCYILTAMGVGVGIYFFAWSVCGNPRLRDC